MNATNSKIDKIEKLVESILSVNNDFDEIILKRDQNSGAGGLKGDKKDLKDSHNNHPQSGAGYNNADAKGPILGPNQTSDLNFSSISNYNVGLSGIFFASLPKSVDRNVVVGSDSDSGSDILVKISKEIGAGGGGTSSTGCGVGITAGGPMAVFRLASIKMLTSLSNSNNLSNPTTLKHTLQLLRSTFINSYYYCCCDDDEVTSAATDLLLSIHSQNKTSMSLFNEYLLKPILDKASNIKSLSIPLISGGE